MSDAAIPYEQRRNPNLPWGYWTLADPGRSGVVDETGKEWSSLRRYLWVGRLGMGGGADQQLDQHCEFLLAILAALDRRVVPIEERVIDFFAGSWDLARHYSSWLRGHGLAPDGLSGGLTHEGRAILLMLASTREAGSALYPIGLATVGPRRGLDRGETRAERERVLAAAEAFAARQPDRFERYERAGQVGIKLIGLPEGPNVPMARVLWSMTFADDHARDRMFAWLVHRLDRWQAWAGIARRSDAQALSEHLLRLCFADEAVEAEVHQA